MTTVADHRQAELVPLEETLVGFPLPASRCPLLAQPKWAAWRRRRRLEHRLPGNFADVLTAVSVFADPATTYQTENKSWRPESLTWDDHH